MKSGFFTSEFILSAVVIIAATAALLTGDLDADKWMIAITGATGAYSLSRGVAKINPVIPSEE